MQRNERPSNSTEEIKMQYLNQQSSLSLIKYTSFHLFKQLTFYALFKLIMEGTGGRVWRIREPKLRILITI